MTYCDIPTRYFLLFLLDIGAGVGGGIVKETTGEMVGRAGETICTSVTIQGAIK